MEAKKAQQKETEAGGGTVTGGEGDDAEPAGSQMDVDAMDIVSDSLESSSSIFSFRCDNRTPADLQLPQLKQPKTLILRRNDIG